MGPRVGKMDMMLGYMIDDIRYSIILLNKAMGHLAVGHLETWMVHFSETIIIARMPIDWATILSNNLDE